MTFRPRPWVAPVQNWRVAVPGGRDVRCRLASAKTLRPIVSDGGDQSREQHLVGGRDPIRVGVGWEVLAPAAAVDVRAQPAVQQAGGVGVGREVERDVDGVGVPERDAQHGEHLGHDRQRLASTWCRATWRWG